jgi:uncharacterized LabA/DUF88 family protein
MESVVIIVDYANVNRSAADKGLRLDYAQLLEYLVADRLLIEAFSFVPIDPNNRTARDHDIETLWTQGFLVTTKVGRADGETYKCDFDVEITMEMIRVATEIKPNIIVLVSGDIDYVPVVEFVRRKGIRVEGAAFFDNASRDLIMKCSSFIELDKWQEELGAGR